ncbi:MAG TPA: AAA family ATPase, partial [Polyangia bacterium]
AFLEVPLAIAISGDQANAKRVLGLVEGRGLSIPLAGRRMGGDDGEDSPFNFVGTVDPEYRLGPLWDKIVLTPNEDKVTEALQIIEPSIERVASLSRASGRGSPSSIVVRLRGSEARVPIGSMGDGLKRLLVLSVNLVTSAGGCLFVDEIDTGLHYSVIAKMWQLLIETSRRLNVQVFASTHSLDCLQALARVCLEQPDLAAEVAVHRLQKEQEKATRYAAAELALALQHEMEIR